MRDCPPAVVLTRQRTRSRRVAARRRNGKIPAISLTSTKEHTRALGSARIGDRLALPAPRGSPDRGPVRLLRPSASPSVRRLRCTHVARPAARPGLQLCAVHVVLGDRDARVGNIEGVDLATGQWCSVRAAVIWFRRREVSAGVGGEVVDDMAGRLFGQPASQPSGGPGPGPRRRPRTHTDGPCGRASGRRRPRRARHTPRLGATRPRPISGTPAPNR